MSRALRILLSLAAIASWLLASPAGRLTLTSVIVTGGGAGSTYRVVLHGSQESRRPGNSSPWGPVFIPSLITHAGSQLAASCVIFRTTLPSSLLVYQEELAWAQAMWARLSVYPRCDAQPAGGINIIAIWTQIVDDQLPTPSLTVQPSFGIVNVPMQIITSSSTRTTLSVSTNAGPLTISARGWISWQFSRYPPQTTPLEGVDRVTWYRPLAPGQLTAALAEHWTGSYQIGGISGPLPTLVQSSAPVSFPIIVLTTTLHNVE
ncbi:MAG: hypothetical protein ACYCWN_05650 [Ferrimicrobium sp.]|uniref:Uncharacterized protein n=1 Tax=Ferrimicrobium acidiphilum TaxID=121039 RepID=A0ABV3Y0P9_9ACTN|nr:hypothetical protein [Ferrimicrobium sp.]MCL5972922.1 hypothetical protein [Actinomycetota bacterium]